MSRNEVHAELNDSDSSLSLGRTTYLCIFGIFFVSLKCQLISIAVINGFVVRGASIHSFLLLILLLGAVAVAVLGVAVLVVSILLLRLLAVLGVTVGLLLGGHGLLGSLLSGGGTARRKTE